MLTGLGTLTLLDLAGEDLEALALLFAAIDEGLLPRTQPLLRLRERLLALLPDEHRTQLAAIAPSPRLDGPTRTSGTVEAVIARLRPALGKAEISFQYRSLTPADTVEQHRVAPYELFQRDGYTYLDAYCLGRAWPSCAGAISPTGWTALSPSRCAACPDGSPRCATRGAPTTAIAMSQRSPGAATSRCGSRTAHHGYDDEGGAVVEACITDLWYARNVLLRYREHCRVLEPPELVELMREAVSRMAEIYGTLPNEEPMQ